MAAPTVTTPPTTKPTMSGRIRQNRVIRPAVTSWIGLADATATTPSDLPRAATDLTAAHERGTAAVDRAGEHEEQQW